MIISDFTYEKLDEIPTVKWDEHDDQEFTSVIIVPTNEIHDSGYMCMAFLFCIKDEIICKSDGYSDVLHLDGIGGYGKWDVENEYMPRLIPPKGWCIDCLPSGYLRIFCNTKIFKGFGLSSFEIFAKDPNKPKRRF